MPTVVEKIRVLLTGRYFLILDKGVLLAEGTILDVLDHDTMIANLWREGDVETITTHVFTLASMSWDEKTKTGFVLTQQGSTPSNSS